MTGGTLETVSELILLCFAPLFLSVAAVWILWQAFKKIEPDSDVGSFWTFIVVVVPFVMFVCLGAAAILHDEIAMWSGSPTVLPLNPPSHAIVAGAVVYIGQTVWLWWRWRRLEVKVKNPKAPAVKREAEEDWRR
jgi:hypothetical protein